jgi:hypothetical protein
VKKNSQLYPFIPKTIEMVKQVLSRIPVFLLLFVTTSCVSGQQSKSSDFATSKVYPSVACVADTSLTFALFLPPQYEKGKPCPLLLLFSPSGDGLSPVNLFSAEASKNGFILAGSNNSKNGMPFDQTYSIYRAMMADLSSRFSINNKAIYLGGFSGGSRVAGAVAITEGGIAGVVGCGAGLPNIDQKPKNPFSYLAVVGIQDFNYSEMMQLNESLELAGFRHHLLEFDGIHQWPPKMLIPDIFTWLKFDAMRLKSIPEDRSEINNFIEKNDKLATAYAQEGKFNSQLEVYIKMKHYLQDHTNIASLQSEINRLSAEKEVIARQKQQKQLLETERDLLNRYLPQIPIQSVEWWTIETAKLRSLSQKEGKPGTKEVYLRVLGSLSMDSYLYSSNALKQGNPEAASRMIEIYRLVDPPNPEHRFMAAKVAALIHNPDEVFNALKQAKELGFKDINRLKSDPDIKPYLQDARIKSLFQGL